MNGNKFECREEFDDFISKLHLEDIVLLESNSKVISIAGRLEKQLESDLQLTDMDIEVMSNPNDKKDFLVICTLGCNFEITKEEEQFLVIFVKVQAVYRVTDLDVTDDCLQETAVMFAKESAYLHIVSFLRVYIMELVNKSGYPRYTLPLFKQPKDTEYVKQD